jgi:hypothetical protein
LVPAQAVTRERVLAFRIARHHLGERAPDAETAAFAGLQDTPPGAAGIALAARADVAPEALEDLVTVVSLRGAPMAVRRDDVALFTTGREPPDEKAARVVIGNAWKELDGITAMEALDRVSAAVADALADGPLVKDDFHQALRERLPRELLWWCKGCGSHHVHPSLWRATGIRGVLAVVGRDGRSPLYGAPPPAPAVEDPGAALARRYLQVHGPATSQLFSWWAGITPSHAKDLWDRAGDLVPVGDKWLLAEDADAPANAPPAAGVRLLPNLDPLASARDREILVPDPAVKKRIWKTLGGPGMVLVDGEVAGLWRPAKKGKRLVLTVEPLTRDLDDEALAEEAERLAPFRGAETAEVVRGAV